MSGSHKRIIGGVALAASVAVASYPVLLRHRCLTWGATPDEIASAQTDVGDIAGQYNGI
jgi:hypothetical protein